MYGKDVKCIQNIDRKPGRKLPCGRSGHRREDNIGLKEVGWEDVNCIYLAQDRVQGTCEHGNVAVGSVNG
jgi:hypothetical protein